MKTFLAFCAFLLAASESTSATADVVGPIPTDMISVYVGGAVVASGKFEVRGGMRAWDAIQQSGGFSSDAHISKATLLRREADGKIVTKSLNLRSGAKSADNILLCDGDRIFVPKKRP